MSERAAPQRYHLRRAPVAACGVLAGLLFGCSSAPKSPPAEAADRDLVAAAAAGQQAFARGAYDAAAEQYGRALARARLRDDPAAIGDQAFNAAVCLAAVGRTVEAGERLAEAEVALRRGGLPLADVLLVGARLAYRGADGSPAALGAASAAAARVLDEPGSAPSDVHRCEIALLRAEIACDQGDPGSAGEHLVRAGALALALPPGSLAAGMARATGRVHALRGEHRAAARSFDEEAQHQRASHRYADMARALLRAARAHGDDARPDLAAERYYRAGLSLFAQEKFADAAGALARADAALAASPDDPLRRVVAALRVEVRKAMPAAATVPASASTPGEAQLPRGQSDVRPGGHEAARP
jgi:tetratricopeptide (TPR) repeat protein